MNFNCKFNDKSYEYSNEVQSVEDFTIENFMNIGNRTNNGKDEYSYIFNPISTLCNRQIDVLKPFIINHLINIIKKLIKDKYFIIPENKDDYYIINYNISRDFKYDIDSFINNIKDTDKNWGGLNFDVIYKNKNIHNNFKFRNQIYIGGNKGLHSKENLIQNLYMYNMNLYYKKQLNELFKENIKDVNNIIDFNYEKKINILNEEITNMKKNISIIYGICLIAVIYNFLSFH